MLLYEVHAMPRLAYGTAASPVCGWQATVCASGGGKPSPPGYLLLPMLAPFHAMCAPAACRYVDRVTREVIESGGKEGCGRC